MAKTAVAIEIGNNAIRAAHIRRVGPRYEVLSAGVKPLGEIKRYPAGQKRDAAISKLIMEMFGGSLPNCPVVVGLSGRAVMLRFAQAPSVSLSRLETLMAFEAESQAVGSKGGLAFDFLPLDVTTAGGTRLVALAVVQLSTLDGFKVPLTQAGAKEFSYSCTSIGLANALSVAEEFDKDTVKVVAEIGEQNLTLSICRGGKFVFARTVAGGVSRIVQSLQDAMGISESEAMDIVRSEAHLLSEDEFAAATDRKKAIHRALNTSLSAMGGALQSTLMFAKNQVGVEFDVDKVLVTGPGAAIRGVERAFGARLGLRVEKLDMLESAVARPSELQDVSTELTGVIGLALGETGLGDRLQIRTSEEREKERYRRHDMFVWFAAPAVGLLLIGVFLAIYLYGSVYASYAETFQQRISQEKVTSKKFDKMRSEIDLLRAEKEFLLAKTSSTSYLLEVLTLVKQVLDDPENAKTFETLFLEQVVVGAPEKNSGSSSISRFGTRNMTADRGGEKTESDYPSQVRLIGWCRSKRGSQAIQLARQFATKLLERDDLIDDFTLKNLEKMEVDEPGWRNMLQIKFEIRLKMSK